MGVRKGTKQGLLVRELNELISDADCCQKESEIG